MGRPAQADGRDKDRGTNRTVPLSLILPAIAGNSNMWNRRNLREMWSNRGIVYSVLVLLLFSPASAFVFDAGRAITASAPNDRDIGAPFPGQGEGALFGYSVDLIQASNRSVHTLTMIH